ncbi:AsmA family protein [Roseibium sp.]|uniref:AsmA family protein n=1 Tax=Roseibium sp. TaxID=1936156 RepID=UPI003A969713
MRRIVFGLLVLFGLAVAAVAAVPYVLPLDTIKTRVIAQVEKAAGWRLRLDGPVSISVVPQFSLVAEKVGISGEAGADGIEFAKAEELRVDLAWAGLIGGDVRVTGLRLVKPQLFLETSASGLTSWAPRRQLTPAEEAAEILGIASSGDAAASVAPETPVESEAPATTTEVAETGADTGLGALARIGVDRLEIEDGQVVYQDRRTGLKQQFNELALTLAAPDLTGEVALESSFIWQGQAVTVTGTAENPLGLAQGATAPVMLTATVAGAELGVNGDLSLKPLLANLKITGSGDNLAAVAEAFGVSGPVPAGSFSFFTKLDGSKDAVSLADLTGTIGSLSAEGQLQALLREGDPSHTGRLLIREAPLADLASLASVPVDATGQLAADLRFTAQGLNLDDVLDSLDINGTAEVRRGKLSGLNLSETLDLPGSANDVSDLNLQIALKGRDAPVSLSGSLSWLGEAFTVQGQSTFATLMSGNPAKTSLRVKAAPVTAGFEGTVSLNGSADGAVSLETANLRDLLARFGRPVEAGNGLRNFAVSGQFDKDGQRLLFKDTSFTLDETEGTASGSVSLGGKPSLQAALTFSRLGLDPYFSSAGSASAAGASAGSGQTSGAQSAGWSDAPLDLSALTLVDASVTADARQITYDGITIDRGNLSADLKNGLLTAKLADLSLYKGAGSADLTVSGASTPSIAAKFSLASVAARSLLQDAAGFDWLEGTAAITLDVKTTGASQKALVSGLTGTASYQFLDGAIRGLNIPKMLRGLSLETLLGWQDTSEEKTDFSSLTASFQIAQGIATTSDLRLIGPLVRMTGKGTTDMPQRTLDWRVEPRVVPTLEGQAPTPRAKGEDKKLAGLGVPVVIKGSWDNPQIYPDIAGILQNPEEAYKQLEALGGELTKIVKDGGKIDKDALAGAASEAVKRATGGNVQIDVQKVIEGKADDEEVLKAVEEGLGLPSGLLQGFGFGKKKKDE